MRSVLAALLALLLLASLAEPACAEDLRAAVPVDPPRCRGRCLERELVLTLPVWVPGFDGTAAVGRVDLSTDSGSDGGLGILDRLFDSATEFEFAFMGAVRYQWSRWTVAVDGFHVRVGNETRFKANGADTNTELSASIGRAWLGYRVARHATPWGSRHRPFVWEHHAIAGLRVYDVSLDSDLFGLTEARRSDTWIDPIVGYRGRLNLRNGCSVALEADVGGFGLGSDLSWRVSAGVEYRPSRRVSILAGWSLLGVEYASGIGRTRFELDLVLAGPQLALSLHF